MFAIFVLTLLSLALFPYTIYRFCNAGDSEEGVVKPWQVLKTCCLPQYLLPTGVARSLSLLLLLPFLRGSSSRTPRASKATSLQLAFSYRFHCRVLLVDTSDNFLGPGHMHMPLRSTHTSLCVYADKGQGEIFNHCSHTRVVDM